MNTNGQQDTDLEALGEILEGDVRGLKRNFPEQTRHLQQVHEMKGTEAARKALTGMVNDNPDFAEAISTSEQSVTGWSALTLEDAFRELPELEYLTGKDIFPFPSLCCVYGYPGSLKSMSLMYLSVCVATGKPFLGDYEVEPRPVIYLDQENGKKRFSRRVRAFASHFDVNPSDVPFTFYSYPNPPFNANETDSVQRLIDAANESNAGLIVVDNLTTISGDADENSKEMAQVMNGLRRVSEHSEATVLVIHHQTKGEANRAANSLRGHSSIEAALDLAIRVERDPDEDRIKLNPTKERDHEVPPFEAEFRFTQKPDGSLRTAHFVDLGFPESDGQNRERKAREMILENHEDGMSQTSLIETVQENESEAPGRPTLKKSLSSLVEENELEVRDGARGAKEYYQPELTDQRGGQK